MKKEKLGQEMANNTEQAELKRLLKSVTPSIKVHQKYFDEIGLFMNSFNSIYSLAKINKKNQSIKKMKIIESQIFKRNYLVAFADDKWFSSVAPQFNALATPSITIFNLTSPPLVIVPESKIRSKNQNFLSILEHEFVHVNQSLLDNFPTSTNFSNKPFPTFFNYMQAEYQANFIQHSYFSNERNYQIAKKDGFSIMSWCVLRGYTQALEKLVLAIYQGQLSTINVEKLLKAFPKQLPLKFKEIGLLESHGAAYAELLPHHVSTAIQILKLPPTVENESFLILINWLVTKRNG